MELIIGEKLKNLRRSKDLTQEEVATHLGISFQAISKWERGEGYPDITMLPYYRYGDYEKALEYANKLPNLFKTRETALVRILKDDEEKNKTARSAIEPLAWLLSYHLNAVAETENDVEYKEKAVKILDILFDQNESDLIKNIRAKMTK